MGALNTNKTGEVATKEDFKLLMNLFIGVAVVAGFGIVTFILQYFVSSQTTFLNLSNQITIQNSKIETLMNIDTQILLQQQGKTKVIYLPAPTTNQ